MKILVLTILCICIASNVFAIEDWAYECSSEAKQIYEKKIIQYQCKNIPKLLRQGNTEDLYHTIRDAGLFRTTSCGSIIKKHEKQLNNMVGVKDAVAFYYYRLGDKQQLKILANSFDKETFDKETNSFGGDHWTVELFGFLDDWDISGVRLVRTAAHADGAGAELLCSALSWRRYLYGETIFKQNWYKFGEKEKIGKPELDHFYEGCK